MKHIATLSMSLLLVAAGAFAQTDTHAHQHHMANMDHDAMFADAMTMHHQDGIRMAQMAVDKAQNAELRSMAQKMIDDQRKDIAEMQSLRGDAPKMSMSMMMDMPGMMSESQMQKDMARLEAATGAQFDAAFTEIMPVHHQGAITMAQHELQMGTKEGMKEIARRIAQMQTREREQLLAMHEDLTDGAPAMTSSSSERQRMSKD